MCAPHRLTKLSSTYQRQLYQLEPITARRAKRTERGGLIGASVTTLKGEVSFRPFALNASTCYFLKSDFRVNLLTLFNLCQTAISLIEIFQVIDLFVQKFVRIDSDFDILF